VPSIDPLTHERMVRQGLAGPPFTSAGEVVERLLAIQGQDPRGFRLAVRSRSAGLTVADVEAGLNDGRFVVGWLNRGTLHLVRAEDYRWLHEVTTPQLGTSNGTRLRQCGVSEDQARAAVGLISAAVGSEGPLTRAELRARLDAAGIPTQGQALVHLLFAAAVAGRIVRGPLHGREQAFAATEQWLPVTDPLGREEALKRLAHRYLEGHAPASPQDLARWAGITLGAARQAFASIAGETADAGDGNARLAHQPPARERQQPKLLGAFDPLLHGWASRARVVGAAHANVITTNGVFRPFALVDGRAVATWRIKAGTVEIEQLEPISETDSRALEAEAADVRRFLAGPTQQGPRRRRD
jgi:hypothetical protein